MRIFLMDLMLSNVHDCKSIEHFLSGKIIKSKEDINSALGSFRIGIKQKEIYKGARTMILKLIN